MVRCEYCGMNVNLPFICRYCGASLCADHRLPERHECSNLFQAGPPKAESTIPRIRLSPGYECGGRGLARREVRDILFAWATLSFCFSTAYIFRPRLFLLYFGVSLVTLGLGFISHELAHRGLARRYGCNAEFRAWPTGLLMALVFALISGGRFIFAAPGAVYVGPKTIGYGGATRREMGLISLVGPLSNALVGLGFLGLTFIPSPSVIRSVGAMGFRANIWLAAFNLIPSGILDGHKIFSWSPKIWMASALPIWALTIISYLY
ncbi:MAG: AN1-type zinc finger domain-containing protein [Candidatus Bathyarchaeia archaeon]